MSRLDDIEYDFLQSDRIYPPTIATVANHPFMVALKDVLMRLPDEIYDEVQLCVSFVVEDPRIMAINVPFERMYPPSTREFIVRFDTIVIYKTAFKLSQKALVGLIAHEIAHSIEKMPDYKASETAADDLVVSWGFGEELAMLQKEKGSL